MSNILIIKHGSLGDIAQASGAIQDIFENHKNDQIYLLTTKPYFDLFKKNPFVQEVILDKRLPRYNLIYLYFLFTFLLFSATFRLVDQLFFQQLFDFLTMFTTFLNIFSTCSHIFKHFLPRSKIRECLRFPPQSRPTPAEIP